MEYEAVIGMEIHAELETETKLFCGCSTRFGAEPNTQTCPVCLGLPGVLSVTNRRAFEQSVKVAIALNCEIARDTHFDRKNYYYPDLPKNFQTSQLYRNLGTGGHVEIFTEEQGFSRVGIWNVHLEEDAGKLEHSETPGEDYTLVDLNRAGTPLLEIVSAPDMRTAEEVEAYMKTVRNTLLYLGVCDCKIEQGSLRFEAGISVRPVGQESYNPRVEVKNLGSITAVLRAVAYEVERQTEVFRSGGTTAQETRLWDDARRRTEVMRTKESAQDYRYFPEPDLPPFRIAEERLSELTAEIPELPTARRRRFMETMGLSPYDAGVLTDERAVGDYFEKVATVCGSPKSAANWVANTVMAALNERRIAIGDFSLKPEALGELIRVVEDGKIGVNVARDKVFPAMIESGRSAEAIIEEQGLAQISDAGALEAVVRKVVEANPTSVEAWRAGNKKALNALIGPVMRETQGKANPQVVRQLLEKALAGA